MQFYDSKDLTYWRKQSELGKAIIIEIPPEMLLNLDIRELNKNRSKPIDAMELQEWIEENKGDLAAASKNGAKEKRAVESLRKNLYGKAESEITKEKQNEPGSPFLVSSGNKSDDLTPEQKVSELMASIAFSEDQIAVIAEGMMEELPAKYLLCFMKKEYSPDVMRQLLGYCRKMYEQEVRVDG